MKNIFYQFCGTLIVVLFLTLSVNAQGKKSLGNDDFSPEPVTKVTSRTVEFTSFVADATLSEGGKSTKSKVYQDRGKLRVETNLAGKGDVVFLELKEGDKIYLFDPNKGSLLPVLDSRIFLELYGGGNKHEFVGSQQVGGKNCEKYKLVDEQLEELNNKYGALFVFVDQDARVPVKLTSAKGNLTIEWKNVQLGVKDDTVFNAPQ